MPPITSRPRLPPRNDWAFGHVQKLVQSYFGPDKSNGTQVDGSRPVKPADWDTIVSAAKRDGAIGPKEFDLMFNAVRSMTGGGRITGAESQRVVGQLAPALDGMKRWQPKDQLMVLKQLEAKNPWGTTSPVSHRPFAAEIQRATAATGSPAMLSQFAAAYNQVNPRPTSAGALQLSSPAVTINEIKLGERVVGQVIQTTRKVTDPSLGDVGYLRSTTYLGPDGKELSFTATPAPERPLEVDIFQ